MGRVIRRGIRLVRRGFRFVDRMTGGLLGKGLKLVGKVAKVALPIVGLAAPFLLPGVGGAITGLLSKFGGAGGLFGSLATKATSLFSTIGTKLAPLGTRLTGMFQGAFGNGMQAYDSTAVPGFPNMFMVLGPNTGLGHHTMVFMIEAQVDYILGALDHAAQSGFEIIEAKPEAEAAYLHDIETRAEGTVWIDGGCKFWYTDPRSDRLTVLWPDFAYAFRDENGTFHPEGYIGTSPVAAAE